MIHYLMLLASGIVLVRCICIAAHTSRAEWQGHPLAFVGISIGYPLIGGGAAGIALNWHHAPAMLLLGLSIWVLSDRRHQYHRELR